MKQYEYLIYHDPHSNTFKAMHYYDWNKATMEKQGRLIISDYDTKTHSIIIKAVNIIALPFPSIEAAKLFASNIEWNINKRRFSEYREEFPEYFI